MTDSMDCRNETARTVGPNTRVSKRNRAWTIVGFVLNALLALGTFVALVTLIGLDTRRIPGFNSLEWLALACPPANAVGAILAVLSEERRLLRRISVGTVCVSLLLLGYLGVTLVFYYPWPANSGRAPEGSSVGVLPGDGADPAAASAGRSATSFK